MKSIYYIFLFALATMLFTACSDDDDMNTTNAEVSFEQAEVSFAESAGMVNIPVRVVGERNGNIKVHLKVTDGTAISEGHYIVTSNVINIPADSDDEVYNVEVIVLDDGNQENDDRNFTVAIESVDGATVSTNSTCNVILKDVDKNPYFKLFGSWTLTAIDAVTGENVTLDVKISDDSKEAYHEKYLICSGFNEAGTYDASIPWVLAYSSEGRVNVVEGIFYAAYNFGSFIGAVCVAPMTMAGRPSDVPIPGTYNETFDEITFNQEIGLVGVKVHEYDNATGEIGELKGRYGNPYLLVKMVKK